MKCKKHDEEKVTRYRADGNRRLICRSCAREYKRDRYGYLGRNIELDRPVRDGGWRGSKDKRIPNDVRAFALNWITGNLSKEKKMRWKNYIKMEPTPMRPYVPGEDLTNISVSDQDTPEIGGMIAKDPRNPKDQWYISKKYFKKYILESKLEK